MNRVLITRLPQQAEEFTRLLKDQGCEVETIPFIETIDIPLETIPQTDWVFFNSPRSVQHFFQNLKKPFFAKYAALSNGTAKAIHDHNQKVSFTGGDDSQQTVEQFSGMLTENETVLIPRSDRSVRRLQRVLGSDRYVELIAYKTRLLNKKPDADFDVVVFTSPSNVKGYFESGNELKKSKAVAIGNTTAEELKAFEITPLIADGYTQKQLVMAVLKAIQES
jgi:uroporphyrinogen-III synthase